VQKLVVDALQFSDAKYIGYVLLQQVALSTFLS